MKIPQRFTAIIVLLLISLPCLAQVSITGRVLSESGNPLPGAMIQVGQDSVKSNAAGEFSLPTGSAEIYRLNYSAGNHFPMVHSYSPLEFTWLVKGSSANQVVVPDVTLVERAAGRVMLAIGGDAMMGRRFSKPSPGEPLMIREEHKAEDTLALLQHIKPYLELADFTTVNLETQVMASKPKQNAPKSYVFFTPPEALAALRLSGVDYVTLGNNHTYDYMEEGLESTVNALDASGLGWSGAGLTESQALQPHRATVGENPMSFLGFLGWAGNFTPNQVAQGSNKGGAAFGTTENIKKAVGNEVAQGYLPVVQYHGSREYTDEPTLVTETRLKQSIDEGAVLAIGHHPHVVQGFEIYKGKLIAYSMGNFIFDQFHYSTKRSYLLYVWMDGDQFHRAEVMPLRIKGYLPMPATDTFRRSILNRVNELSTRRNIVLQASGGNAVINPMMQEGQSPQPQALMVPRKDQRHGKTVWHLKNQAWNAPLEAVAVEPGDSSQVWLGHNLLPMGHLESHYLFDAPDRSWIADGSQTIVSVEDAPSGRNVMQLNVPVGKETGTIGMRTFEYTFEPGTPTSFLVRARSDSGATVTAYQQWRKQGENRTEALETAKLRLIGEHELGADGWQELRFDFDSPRVTAISYRIVLQVTPLDGTKDHHSWFDDISLIEWLSPPQGSGYIPGQVKTSLVSHAGLVIE